MGVSAHGVARMRQRGASFADVKHALLTASRCRAQPDDRWRLDSEDLDGDDLTLVVFVDDGVLVITLF
jgi:hypothetical protein